MASLEERIFGVVPIGTLSFVKLLGLIKIEESDTVKTAAVTCGIASKLLINPSFVEKYCKTDEHLLVLVLHELFHISLGHTRLFPRVTQEQNIAFDAIINAQICQLLPHPNYTSFFTEFYKEDQFPLNLLRPVTGWPTKRDSKFIKGREKGVHADLYRQNLVTCSEVYELLTRFASCKKLTRGKKVIGNKKAVSNREIQDKLLGNHDTEEQIPKRLAAEITEIVTKWPREGTSKGRSEGTNLFTTKLSLRSPREEAIAMMRKAFVAAADLKEGGEGLSRRTPYSVATPLPLFSHRDRSATARRLLGLPALLYRNPIWHTRIERTDKVHLYLDVSLSMEGEIELVYAAIVPLKKHLHEPVHLFSTTIENASFRSLETGRIATTGGTHISCVTEHIIESHVKRAVIVTDGYVGTPPEDHINTLKKRWVIAHSLITPKGHMEEMEFCKVWKLPPLEG